MNESEKPNDQVENHTPESKDAKSDALHKSKEVLSKSKESVKKFSQQVNSSLHSEGKSNIFAAFAYVPILGPLVGWLYKKDQSLVKTHTIHAIYLQLSLLVILLAAWLLQNLPVVSSLLDLLKFNQFITNAIVYLSTIGFLVLSVLSATKAFQEQVWLTPVLYKFINKIFKLDNSSNNE